MKNIILGAGIAGITAHYELRQNNIPSIIIEKNDSWGGLLDNFTINGFRFDKFIHLSFTDDQYVNNVFYKTPLIKHQPQSSNYYKGFWLKHPAQNNLFPLAEEEKRLIVKDFINREDKQIDDINNYEDWLRVQYGNYFAENFPMIYTEKYWTLHAKDLETKWIGKRMYKPTLEEVLYGCDNDITPNTYYAKEMRYPKKGGYKTFLTPMIEESNISLNEKIVYIDIRNKNIQVESGRVYNYDNLISSLPLPEICNLIKDIPKVVLDASNKLNYTSGYLISLGFNKPDMFDNLWFYIYDQDILPARVYSPSQKSRDNVPLGCSSLQAELYFNKGEKLNTSDKDILDSTIEKFIKMGLFREDDIIVRDIRTEKYANVVFDHAIYDNRTIVLSYLSENDIISVGRFGEWDYFWSDQSMLSGRNGAHKLMMKYHQ